MKKVISSLLMLTVLVLCLLPLQASAEETASGSCGVKAKWAFDEATGTLTISGTGAVKVSTFADDSDDENTPWERYNAQITKLVISEGITSVNAHAFAGMQALVSVEMADTVISLGESIFAACEKLTSIKLSENLSGIPESAFNYCSTLASIHIPASVKSIASGAFDDCDKLVSVTMADGVETIGFRAFFDCDALSSVMMSGTLIEIGDGAFGYCDSLAAISIPESVESIGEYAFEFCKSLTAVTIPDSVTWLGCCAFQACEALTEVKLPKNLTEIPEYAFVGCKNLKDIQLPESLSGIGSKAFRGCSALESVTFPASLGFIGVQAYAQCTNLSEITFTGSAPTVSTGAFQGVSAMVSYPVEDPSWNISVLLNFEDTTRWVYDDQIASGKCGEMLTWTMDSAGVLKISGEGDMTNYQSKGDSPWYKFADWITCVELGEGVTSVGDRAFTDCVNLSAVTIPDTLTDIGVQAFYCCESLSSFTVPKNVSNIGTYAFYGCSGLTSFQVDPQNAAYSSDDRGVLFNKEKTVLVWAVAVLSGDYEIPDSVMSLEKGAFIRQKKLTGIVFPDEMYAIADHAFYECSSLSRIDFPECLEEIGTNAFSNCTSLTAIRFPGPLGRISSAAFSSCTNLREIEFTGNAPGIFFYAFSGVTATVTFPATDCTWTSEVYQYCDGNLTWVCYCSQGHIAVTDPVVEPTCTTTGLREGRHCDECGEILLAQTEIPMTEHTYYDRVCKYCGAVEPVKAPKIIASNKLSSGKPRLTWDPVDGAVKYQIFRSTTKNGTYTRVWTQKGTTYTNTKAEAGTLYYYKVKSVDVNGNVSDFSNRVSRTCDLARPVVETSNDAATGKVKLTWDAVEGAKSYKVYRATSKGGRYVLMKTLTDTTYINNSAKAGTKYYYWVKAIHENSNANSVYSTVVSRTCDLARPTISIKRNNAGKPRISWNSVDGAVKYEVYRATSKDGKYTRIATTKNTYQVNKNAVAGKTYYYKVKAIHSNTNANSAFSTVKYIKAK